MQFYCLKCRAKKELEKFEETVMKGRMGERRAAKAICPDCGTKLFRILGKVEKPAEEPKSEKQETEQKTEEKTEQEDKQEAQEELKKESDDFDEI